MITLFDMQPQYPPGFEYLPSFISQEEEEALIKAVDAITLHPFRFQGFEARRKVASFGYDYSFDQARLNPGQPIPPAFDFLLEKLGRHTRLSPGNFAELLVTEYPPGSVINWHRDAPPFDLIAGISLGAACSFRLRPHDKKKQGRGSIISLTVAPRSLYILKDEARSEWQHSIAPVKSIRYSITLRTLR